MSEESCHSILFNPTVVPRILTEILDFLTVADLENCRLVDSQWNEEACRILRKKKTIIFNSVEQVCGYVARFSPSVKMGFPHPHGTFTFFVSVQREMDGGKYPGIIDQFLDYFGHDIKSLHLSLEEPLYGQRHFTHFLNEKSLPNLKILSFIFSGAFGTLGTRESKNNLGKCAPIRLPKLKTICLQIIGHDIVVNVDSVIRHLLIDSKSVEKITYQIFGVTRDYLHLNRDMTLSEILIDNVLFHPDVKLKNIKYLEYLMPVNDRQLLFLTEKSFPFLELCYLEILESVQWTTLESFFSVYGKTLKTLHLDTQPANRICKQYEFFSIMPNLNHLSLEAFEGTLKLEKFPSLKILGLKRLDVDRFFENLSQSEPKGNAHLVSCNRIHSIVFENCSIFSPAVAPMLSQGFRYLRSLKFDNTTDEILHSVYVNLPKLEELKVGGDTITDEGVCGLPPFVTKHVDVMLNLYRTADSLRQLPFIGDLQNLKVLELDSEKVSDASFVFGIAKCRNLRKVRLCSCGGLLTLKSVQETLRLPELSSASFYVRKHGLIDMPKMRRVIRELNFSSYSFQSLLA